MTVGGLAGGLIAPSPQLATAPIAAMFLGTAIATFPASLWMARVGTAPRLRRRGLARRGRRHGGRGRHLAGLAAAARRSAPSSSAPIRRFAQFYRFAAGEVADDAFRPRAISLVLAGGIVAALAGPLLGRLGGPLLRPEYVGLVPAARDRLAARRWPAARPAHARADSRDRRRRRGAGRCGVIVAQPAYLVALFGAATGYGVDDPRDDGDAARDGPSPS